MDDSTSLAMELEDAGKGEITAINCCSRLTFQHNTRLTSGHDSNAARHTRLDIVRDASQPWFSIEVIVQNLGDVTYKG
eukprot:scaffold49682_cov20-Prasinocladus_malaysianus.AAC.1